LRRRIAFGCALALAALCTGTFAADGETTGAAAAGASATGAATGTAATRAPARVEARSADLLAVALVQDARMTIHLSRLIDNAPVRDATVTVVLRGIAHPATAESDGSYTLQATDLTLPGAAAIEIQVALAAARQSLKGTLQVSTAGESTDKNTARQLWWWVLNFAVCIGFLWLISRRRKTAQRKEPV
jgi:hypothetical protein